MISFFNLNETLCTLSQTRTLEFNFFLCSYIVVMEIMYQHVNQSIFQYAQVIHCECLLLHDAQYSKTQFYPPWKPRLPDFKYALFYLGFIFAILNPLSQWTTTKETSVFRLRKATKNHHYLLFYFITLITSSIALVISNVPMHSIVLKEIISVPIIQNTIVGVGLLMKKQHLKTKVLIIFCKFFPGGI